MQTARYFYPISTKTIMALQSFLKHEVLILLKTAQWVKIYHMHKDGF
jgi:hypothetical protein